MWWLLACFCAQPGDPRDDSPTPSDDTNTTETGAKGETGETGEKGETGETGETGEPGVPGVPALQGAQDWSFTWWPQNFWTNWGQWATVRYVQTGFYGLSIDVLRGSVSRLGVLKGQDPDNAVIEALPGAKVNFTAIANQAEWPAERFAAGGDSSNPTRLIDMGRFMQHLDIPEVSYGDPNLSGQVEIAAMPRSVALTHAVQGATARIDLEGAFLQTLTNQTWVETDRAASAVDADGDGWTFIVPPGATLTLDGQRVRAEAPNTVTLMLVPSSAGDADLWVNPSQQVSVRYDQLQRDGTGDQLSDAAWDWTRGAFVVPLADMTSVGAPTWPDWNDQTMHNWYNRHQLVVENLSTNRSTWAPLVFEGGNNAAFYIVGGSPLFRDPDGQPTGLPIQISKNWHEQPYWYHLYSGMALEPEQVEEVELTFAHARWGETYAVAHAQLSLVGWGRNQQWDESSIGVFGESITYDPDLTLGRAMVDDVRPFLVQTDRKWHWTGNVGGADFAVYVDEAGQRQRPGTLRTEYEMTGPNLTSVHYRGVSQDGRLQTHVTTELGRTDDLVRAWYHIELTALDDIDPQRLALFQMAADNYGDNGFTRYAHGNADGVLVDQPVPASGASGYASDNDRAIAVTGTAPWTMLYANQRSDGNLPEHHANVGFIVRHYAVDGVVTTPTLNRIRTNNGGWHQVAFELGAPDTLPAGTTVSATVEYVVSPSDKTSWYGASDWLTALQPDDFNSPEMVRKMADEGQLTVEVTTGQLLRTHPVEIQASDAYIPAEFELSGGLGYVPVTLHGLPRPDGWTLERMDGDWVAVDQSVEGNDWWQATLDPSSGTWALVFNLDEEGLYRLSWPEPE